MFRRLGMQVFKCLTLTIGSPRWLARRGRYDEARESLARIRGLKNDTRAIIVNQDFDEILARVKMEQDSGVGTWLECFLGVEGIPRLAYRTYLLMILQVLIHDSGGDMLY